MSQAEQPAPVIHPFLCLHSFPETVVTGDEIAGCRYACELGVKPICAALVALTWIIAYRFGRRRHE